MSLSKGGDTSKALTTGGVAHAQKILGRRWDATKTLRYLEQDWVAIFEGPSYIPCPVTSGSPEVDHVEVVLAKNSTCHASNAIGFIARMVRVAQSRGSLNSGHGAPGERRRRLHTRGGATSLRPSRDTTALAELLHQVRSHGSRP
jgi:hypothetical protein